MTDQEYRTLRQEAILARLEREEALHTLKTQEMLAIIRHLEEHEVGYEGLGKNEAARDLAHRTILNDDLDYQRARRDWRRAEQAALERDADLDAYLEGRRREREDISRAQIELGHSGQPALELTSP